MTHEELDARVELLDALAHEQAYRMLMLEEALLIHGVMLDPDENPRMKALNHLRRKFASQLGEKSVILEAIRAKAGGPQ